MKVKLFLIGVLAILLTCGTEMSLANVLQNGDFEDTSGTFPNGWFTRKAGANPSLIHAGLAGSTTANFLKYVGNGDIGQEFPQIFEWELNMLMATGDPGSGTNRSFNVSLCHGFRATSPTTWTWDGGLYIRVVDQGDAGVGDIEVYDKTVGWMPVLTDLVGFSVDANADNDFSDAEDTLLVNQLRVVGHYGSASPSYDIYFTDSSGVMSSKLGIQSWITAIPAVGQGLNYLDLVTGSAKAGSLVDNVTLVPEPGMLAMLLAAGLLLVCWSRFRR